MSNKTQDSLKTYRFGYRHPDTGELATLDTEAYNIIDAIRQVPVELDGGYILTGVIFQRV